MSRSSPSTPRWIRFSICRRNVFLVLIDSGDSRPPSHPYHRTCLSAMRSSFVRILSIADPHSPLLHMILLFISRCLFKKFSFPPIDVQEHGSSFCVGQWATHDSEEEKFDDGPRRRKSTDRHNRNNCLFNLHGCRGIQFKFGRESMRQPSLLRPVNGNKQ